MFLITNCNEWLRRQIKRWLELPTLAQALIQIRQDQTALARELATWKGTRSEDELERRIEAIVAAKLPPIVARELAPSPVTTTFDPHLGKL